ncbi:MAG: hypothetical protein HC771_07685 [Synechococcales cyanobacterium CRU_2_2]|nr:hypothetical protein [Synechococcales cyanobacterium CRU_2_2]
MLLRFDLGEYLRRPLPLYSGSRWSISENTQTKFAESASKLEIYRSWGVLFYAVYNPRYWQRDRQLPFEVYRLVDGVYQLQRGEPVWRPEVGLGLGRCLLPQDPLGREVLSWFGEGGDRLFSEAETQAQRADRLAQRLRELGEEEV